VHPSHRPATDTLNRTARNEFGTAPVIDSLFELHRRCATARRRCGFLTPSFESVLIDSQTVHMG
jgi:hypothetical protein